MMRRESWWATFWHDWRRLNTYMMVVAAVAVVALSFKAHRVYFRNDRDPWLHHPRYFARWMPPPRLLHSARPMPNIRRPVPRKSYTACRESLPRMSRRPGIC